MEDAMRNHENDIHRNTHPPKRPRHLTTTRRLVQTRFTRRVERSLTTRTTEHSITQRPRRRLILYIEIMMNHVDKLICYQPYAPSTFNLHHAMTLLSTQMHVTWTYIHDMKPFARRPWYIVLRKQADQPQEHHHLTWSETQKHEYSRMNETLNDYGHASSYMRTMPLIS